MIKIVAASSLNDSIKKLDELDRERLADTVYTYPGLNLDPNTDSCCLEYLTSAPKKHQNLVLWHDLLNNTVTSHPKKKNKPQKVKELIETLRSIPNLFCVVTCQRESAPYLFDDLVRALSCYVIDVTQHVISASEQLDDSVIAGYRRLHQSPDLELRTLGVVLHYYPNINRIFKTRGTKLRTTKERREAKRRKTRNS